MARITKAQQQDQAEARTRLLELLGDVRTIHCNLRHVSRSGMMRHISLHFTGSYNGEPYLYDITHLAARVLRENIHQANGGIKIGGCGMDMGHALVYALSIALFCPEQYDHDAAYRLQHRWI